GIPIIVYSVTPLHVGSGRSLGAVDLPIQRDPYNYPVVYSSSFKGALRDGVAARLKGETGNDGGNENLLKCFFGPDVKDTQKESGRIILTDLLPILYPVANEEYGYVYVTTEYLLGMARDLVGVALGEEKGKEFMPPDRESSESQKQLHTPLGSIDVKSVLSLKDLKGRTLGSLVRDKVYVLGDDAGLLVVESALVRVTRNRLDENKRVAGGALWTEEYIPAGTVMVGAAFDGGRKNSSCDSSGLGNGPDALERFVGLLNGAVITVGGKESIGRGLLRFVAYT
ncbi:MAG: type III-B CRISPR module RAMP protein Cmr4, partial [Conexivisphaera sp.]